MVDVDGDLYLFAKDLVANPGSEQPSLVRSVVLSADTDEWARRSDSEILGSWNAVAVDGTVFFPNSGSALLAGGASVETGSVPERRRVEAYGLRRNAARAAAGSRALDAARVSGWGYC